MLSKNDIKLFHSLRLKKNRNKELLFTVEGPKLVDEALKHSHQIVKVYHTQDYNVEFENVESKLVSQRELSKISNLKTPNSVIALCKAIHKSIDTSNLLNSLSIGLEDIRDPGNLGTIIRIADWFGIETIICSQTCVDIYNPKVVQASMGSIFRVDVVYCDLFNYLSKLTMDYPVYATTLDGNNIYKEPLKDKGMLLIGNESNGLSQNMLRLVKHQIKIPAFNNSLDRAESLNAAVACAIACSEFKRRLY